VATTTLVLHADPERVFAVLADGWTYSDWVVGTAHIRDVDADWPAPGSRIHHKVGPWPVSLRDHTTAVECEPGRMLLVKLRLWPLGAGIARFLLEPAPPDRTRVTLVEQFTEGPLLGLRNRANDVLLHLRNRESLRRLADIAVRRPVPSATEPRE
jgi:Polyketide cyclase / dehydrase and lipid transport